MNDRPGIESRIHNARYRRAVKRILRFAPNPGADTANQNLKQAAGTGKNPRLSPTRPRPS